VLSLFLMSIGSVAFGMYQGIHSEAFLLRDIEVKAFAHSPQSPLDNLDITRLVSPQVGKVSLLSLDLKLIEKKIAENEWIEKVRLEKKLNHTLSIFVTYRQPLALIQKPKGELAYVDYNGMIFGSSHFKPIADLPLLTGFDHGDSEIIMKALKVVKLWEHSRLRQVSLISTVHWDSDRGFRLLISYPKKKTESISAAELDSRIRAFVDIGHEIDASLDNKLLHLSNVIRYLSSNSIAVRQIWADVGKKIVVKTGHGS
jgi:hypothetical protein